MQVSRNLLHFVHHQSDVLRDCQHMFSLLVNGQVDPLGFEKSGPILSTPILISEHMVLPLGHCYMRMFPFAICEVGFSFFLGECRSTLNVGSADVFSSGSPTIFGLLSASTGGKVVLPFGTFSVQPAHDLDTINS